ncbi:MAG: F0F1 ATP synthase subunit A [Armatimonadota bacterium]
MEGHQEGSIANILYHVHLKVGGIQILPLNREWFPDVVVFSWLVILFLTILSYLATRRMQRIPGPLQNVVETVVSALDGFICGLMGPRGKQFTPLVGTFFIYIFCMNLLGIVPGMKSPTANATTTIALALVAIVAVHYHSIRILGIKNYVLHSLGEPLWLAPLMFPLHLIGELARPLSLAIRLFGNIFGEDTVIVSFAMLSPFILKWLPIPVQVPMLAFAIFGGFVQALVFSTLTAIYIVVTIGDHEEGHDEGARSNHHALEHAGDAPQTA